jgi:hypothetical protein
MIGPAVTIRAWAVRHQLGQAIEGLLPGQTYLFDIPAASRP